MAEQMTNRARLESETYTKLHEVMKQKSGGSADSIYPKLKAFSRFAQDMVTDVRGPAQWQGYYGCLAVSELGLEVLHKELLDERKREAYVGQ